MKRETLTLNEAFQATRTLIMKRKHFLSSHLMNVCDMKNAYGLRNYKTQIISAN